MSRNTILSAPVATDTKTKIVLGILMICCVTLLGVFSTSMMAGIVRLAGTTTPATCFDSDSIIQLTTTSTIPLPLTKGYTYDTISDPTFKPPIIPNPPIEAAADYCTINGIKTSSCSGVGCGLMERYCTNGRRSSRYYLYNGAAGYSRLQEVCPNGCQDGACINIPPILVIKENKEGELIGLNPPSAQDKWYFKTENIRKRIDTSQSYDFLLIVPTLPGGINDLSFSSSIANRNITGIGSDVIDSYPIDLNLKQIIILPFNKSGFFSANTFSDTLVKMLVFHEIGHHWLANVKGFFADPQQDMGGHYKSNVDLFYGNELIDPMNPQMWISKNGIKNGIKKCISLYDIENFDSTNIKFSKLSLYLMGLIPPKEVPAINVYDYSGEQFFAGPSCYLNPVWTTTRQISINNIITANGARIPSYKDSQKNFKAMFVIIVPFNKSLDDKYVQYVEKWREALPKAWAEATDHKSTIKLN